MLLILGSLHQLQAVNFLSDASNLVADNNNENADLKDSLEVKSDKALEFSTCVLRQIKL
jgi:hypothetical protein